MAKLYFRYGAMNSGKSTSLLQAAYNYEERHQRVLLAKPDTDTKGDGQIVSRLGVTRSTDFLVRPDDDLAEVFATARRSVVDEADSLGSGRDVSCLLVDEAQFLTAPQVDALLRIAVRDDIPVLAYGIRTDFRTRAFAGAARLFEVAHSLEELKTICRCGRKAIFNARLFDGRYVFDGEQVAIDGAQVTYEALCGACYLDESGEALA